MRKVYVITGSIELQGKEITKVIYVASSIKKATKYAQKCEGFYENIEIITEVLL